MASGRMLKRRIAKSDKFAALKSDKARLLYLLMIPFTDVEGRVEAESIIIKGNICPYITTLTLKNIPTTLQELHDVGLIVLYEAGSHKCLQYTRFHEFQSINKARESESCIPAPTPEQCKSKSGLTPSEYKSNISKVKVKGEKKFTPPTLQQVKDYIAEKKYEVDADKFFNYFTEGNWVDSRGNSVKNWKQKIITWSKSNGNNRGNSQSGGPKDQSRDFASQTSEFGESI